MATPLYDPSKISSTWNDNWNASSLEEILNPLSNVTANTDSFTPRQSWEATEGYVVPGNSGEQDTTYWQPGKEAGSSKSYYTPGTYASGDISLYDIFTQAPAYYQGRHQLGETPGQYGASGNSYYETEEDYNNARGNYYKSLGLDPSQVYLGSEEFDNPLSRGNDMATGIYQFDPTSETASVAGGTNRYNPGGWIGGGRGMIKGAVGGLASYFAGPLGTAAAKAIVKPNEREMEDFQGVSTVGSVLGAGSGAQRDFFGSIGSTGSPVADASIRGGLTSGLQGNSVATGAITSGVGNAVSGETSSFLGGTSLGNAIGNYVGGVAAGEVGSRLTGGTTGGNNVAQTNTQPGSPSLLNTGVGLINTGLRQDQLNNQIKDLEGIFGQNSAYAQNMRKELDWKDAIGGRNSQYGARAVDLQAKLAQNAATLAPTIASLNTQRGGNQAAIGNNLQSLISNPQVISQLEKLIPGIGKTLIGSGGSSIPGNMPPNAGPQLENQSTLASLFDTTQQMDEFNTGPVNNTAWNFDPGVADYSMTNNYDDFWAEYEG